MHTHTHTHTHRGMHARTHTHTQTHVHIQVHKHTLTHHERRFPTARFPHQSQKAGVGGSDLVDPLFDQGLPAHKLPLSVLHKGLVQSQDVGVLVKHGFLGMKCNTWAGELQHNLHHPHSPIPYCCVATRPQLVSYSFLVLSPQFVPSASQTQPHSPSILKTLGLSTLRQFFPYPFPESHEHSAWVAVIPEYFLIDTATAAHRPHWLGQNKSLWVTGVSDNLMKLTKHYETWSVCISGLDTTR